MDNCCNDGKRLKIKVSGVTGAGQTEMTLALERVLIGNGFTVALEAPSMVSDTRTLIITRSEPAT